MAKNGPSVFKKGLKVFIDLANELHISPSPVNDFYTLPMIKDDRELAAAIILQNLMQPKNHHRTESINGKQYHELKSNEEAKAYLS